MEVSNIDVRACVDVPSLSLFLTSKRKVCCNFGAGNVRVFLGTPSNDTLLAYVDSTFSDQAVRPFVASARGIIQRQVTMPSPAATDKVSASPTSDADATPTTESPGKVTTLNTTPSEAGSLSSTSSRTSNGTLPTSGDCYGSRHLYGEYGLFLAFVLSLYFLN
jgi:hypothetical protein